MSDTLLKFRGHYLRIKASFVAMILYVIADACVSLGQSLSSVSYEEWHKQWWMQHAGFWLSQLGSTALMIKAFYSHSSPPPEPPPTPPPTL